jgi:hypothetical protein
MRVGNRALAEAQRSNVDRVSQEFGERRAMPYAAGRTGNALAAQVAGNLTERAAIGSPAEDAFDDGGIVVWREDLALAARVAIGSAAVRDAAAGVFSDGAANVAGDFAGAMFVDGPSYLPEKRVA